MTSSLPTRLAHAGRTSTVPGGQPVNPPVVRASTVLFDSVAQQREMRARRDTERLFTYGARGNPTNFALEDMVTMLEGGYRTRLFPSGLAAAAMTILAYVRPGQHVLLPDCVYEPVRNLANGFLRQHNIAADFYAADGSDLDAKLRPETRLVYVEAPGSLTYEMLDLPALAARAHAHGALVAADNTWGSGLLYRPLELGADISLMAATKYLGGHSDVMMGTVCTTEAAWPELASMADAFGITVSPDDAYLVQRGIRSLSARRRNTSKARLRWRSGCMRAPMWPKCFAPRCRTIPITRYGNAIATAPMACCRSRCVRARRWPPNVLSTALSCSASAHRGAASRAWRCWPTCAARAASRTGHRTAP